MNTRTIVAVFTFLAIGITARAQNSTRMLMYTFHNGAALIHVALIDTPPTPRAVVTSVSAPGHRKAFNVSRQQFERMWRTLQFGGAEKFAGDASSSRTFDAINNYVFSVGYMPNGKKINFVVPKTRASGSLVSLARELEAFAH